MLDNSWHKNICEIIKHEIFVIEKEKTMMAFVMTFT